MLSVVEKFILLYVLFSCIRLFKKRTTVTAKNWLQKRLKVQNYIGLWISLLKMVRRLLP